MSPRVLVSTHDLGRAGALREALGEHGYTVELVTPDEDITASDDAELLLLSAAAGTSASSALVTQARSRLDVPVLGWPTPGTPPDPALLDALDDVFAPGTSPDEAAVIARTLLERKRLQESTGIVGETDAMRQVLERVVQIAPVDATVLVTGESGTGKEMVARGLHGLSARRHKPFIPVNVAALPDTLLESELFGHEKGAFTGAVDARRGLFELAHGGTIFLDEIGEMPLATQTKLLRVLEQREFLRVGGEKPIRVDARIVAATNRDLRRQVDEREFRKDLFYRLNVLSIELPPLRERRDDIPRLIRAFVREASRRHDRPPVRISPEALRILTEHDWPGNVRELRNLVESMVVLAPGREIRPQDIPPEVRGESPQPRSTLPVPLPRRDVPTSGELRPELELVFRTLVDLRMDLNDLRRDFESFKERGEHRTRTPLLLGSGRSPELVDSRSEAGEAGSAAERVVDVQVRPDAEEAGSAGAPAVDGDEAAATEAGGEEAVVFRPGMTMDELERQAIAAALREVEGNRRKAAEMLGIGERTLYRKIRKYDLEEEGMD